jgi:hypothetical protein
MNPHDARPSRPLADDLDRGLARLDRGLTAQPTDPGTSPLAVDLAENTDDTYTLAIAPTDPGDVIARVLTAVTANPRTLAAALIVMSRSTIGTPDKAEFSRAVYELAIDRDVVAALAIEISSEQVEDFVYSLKTSEPDGCAHTPCSNYAVAAGLCAGHAAEEGLL